MIISKCPLRISLVGGSTDLESYLDTYQDGSIIGFPCDLYTYITLNKRNDEYYKINYSKDEYVKNPNDIINDIAREVIIHFKLPPVTICFNADIPSTGSGLASSSSYLIALISAVNKYLNLNMSIIDICELALNIERKFNPLTGYQDPYGCGIGGFKRINFKKDSFKTNVSFEFLNSNILDKIFVSLIPTQITRSSSNILSTIDIHKSKNLMQDVTELNQSIINNNDNQFWKIINNAWEKKKQTSIDIINNELILLENKIKNENSSILGMKLCGAGGGGYFLVFSKSKINNSIKISIDNFGVKTWKI
jgi:D-glycero-alpha-D-manno-heptose-7-phosphate kinase